MSVDIEEMAAHLDGKRQADVQEQYHARATHATTAFLLCFFMGYLGAHRFYLGQWRSGLAHLVIFALGAVGVVGGFLTGSPINAALFVIGGLLILASLIWEVIDLGRIDDEIHRRNLLLAEGLIAGALLSDHSAMEQAASKLDEVVHTAATQSRAAGALPAAATGGAISLEELAHARQLAEQSGHASISYDAMSTFNVSATPEERQGEHPVFEPATTTERHVNTEPLPNSSDGEQAIETRTHSVDGYHVTDAVETDRVSGPSAGEALGLGAAALGAAGLGFGLAEAAHAHEPPPEPIEAAPVEPVSPEPMAWQAAPEVAPAISDRYEIPPEAPQFDPYGETGPLAAAAPEPVAAYAAPEATHAGADVTDAGAPNFMEPASDVAFASAYPSFVTLPEQATPLADPDATQPDIPLYFTGDEAPAAAPVPAVEPAAESYAPPVPDLYGAAPQAQPAASAWDAPTEPVAPAEEPNRFAEVAGLGALAGAGALAADAWAHHEHAPVEPVAEATPVEAAPVVEAAPLAAEPLAVPVEPVAPAAPKMKRIRVKHRIVVEGQVVREEVVEREVPADADMAAAARQIQMELEQGQTPSADEIARLANLSSDEQVEVRRRVEGLGE